MADDLLLHATEDPDEEVRLAAARGLLQSRGEEEIEHVFTLALSPNLLTRVVLTEDLRRHAMELCAGPVRTVLRGENMQRVRAALEILVAWERAIPLDDVREFLEHYDRRIRVQAFRLAPLVAANFVTRLALVRALHDSDQEIRTLAVIAVGRLKITETMPELALCMRDGDLDLAHHAAEALAAMPRGQETLAELASGPDSQTSRAASEALARGRSNP
jgi:HEAT repeat protein